MIVCGNRPESAVLCFRAVLFAKSKNVLLCHLFADAIEEEGAGAKAAGGGKKKGGGSMQTISATHRVSVHSSHPESLQMDVSGTIA